MDPFGTQVVAAPHLRRVSHPANHQLGAATAPRGRSWTVSSAAFDEAAARPPYCFVSARAQFEIVWFALPMKLFEFLKSFCNVCRLLVREADDGKHVHPDFTLPNSRDSNVNRSVALAENVNDFADRITDIH